MSFDIKNKKTKIKNKKIFQNELFSNNFFELEKALNSTTNLKSSLKMYVQNEIVKQFSIPLQQLRKRIKLSQMQNISKSKILSLNESILHVLYKDDDFRGKSVKIFTKNRSDNDLFMKKFYNLQKVREKAVKNRLNSAILGPCNFKYFNELVNQYKKKGILIKSDMFKNKDLFKISPVFRKEKRDLDFLYLFNHDKYFKETNENFKNISINDKTKEQETHNDKNEKDKDKGKDKEKEKEKEKENEKEKEKENEKEKRKK